ncbi:sigma-70 family RNA polymerase sigma factor [Lysobacter enzymogenes]|uniref:sigma-70 family RNA polymerase sigma factor n=1 Tax=Lysobacter enzymogenes TaxID=69 RepID=UPI0018E95B8D|nr:sigma-70 family RNA polymerase sigma factor [Lysobacter enzymogenes]UZW61272.1 sigma-70 family RNA polymerase sigma factor [Lysobacter enzymogenes]
MTAPPALAAEDDAAPAAEAALWAALRRDGSTAAREALFLRYQPYAQALAARIYGGRHSREVEFRDYQQLAYIGLLDSMDRYDPQQGAGFKTFCTPRITGNVLDGLRQLSEAQEQISLKRRLQRDRLSSLKDGGRDGKLAGRKLDALSELAVGLAIGHMLEGTGMYADGEQADRHDGYAAVAWQQTCRSLRQAVDRLPADMAKVVGYHYFHSLPFEQIAGILGLSKGRISQIHRAALTQLRDKIQPHSPSRTTT